MKRIESIDLLRGIAVLGILIMNIQSFSMPSAAYINPMAYGDLSGANKWVWIISHLLADLKFMALFSMLFGAGIVLMTDKLKSSGRREGATWHFRNFWLLLFGILHVALLWNGDILIMYSICGFFVYFLRNKSAKTIFRTAISLFIIPILLTLFQGMSWDFMPPDAIENIMDTWNPSASSIQHSIAVLTGDSLADKMNYRIEEYIGVFIYYFLGNGLWRIMALMLFGMYLYKKEILTGVRDSAFYKKMFVICFVLGLSISAIGVYYNFHHDWLPQYGLFTGTVFNYIGSLLTAISYLCLVMLWSKSSIWSNLQLLLQRVGKMAFTNYILMSVISTLIFNHFGLFGSFERWEQLLAVFAIWAILLMFTHLWFRRFRMGPLEWLWRSLTYRKWAKI